MKVLILDKYRSIEGHLGSTMSKVVKRDHRQEVVVCFIQVEGRNQRSEWYYNTAQTKYCCTADLKLTCSETVDGEDDCLQRIHLETVHL